MANTWYLYYTIHPCGSGYNSSLTFKINDGASIGNFTLLVPCEVDYDAYVIETFINHLVQYYGLVDTDTIYVKDVLYTKRWICNTNTGICSQIGSGSGYVSEAECKNIWPCNPNQWKIDSPTLTGTVSVSGIYLAWSLTPKNGSTIDFNFGNSDMTPVIYTDSTGVTQIGLYQSGNIWAGGLYHYAMNNSYHGGSADFYLDGSELNIISQIPGYVWEIQYPKDAIIPGTGAGTEIGIGTEETDSEISNWFSKKTCVTSTICIPNWQLVGVGALFFIIARKKKY